MGRDDTNVAKFRECGKEAVGEVYDQFQSQHTQDRQAIKEESKCNRHRIEQRKYVLAI